MKIKKILTALFAVMTGISAFVPAVPAKADENWKTAYEQTIEKYKNSSDYNPYACYGLYDVDKNGIPELFISPSPYGEVGDGDNTRLFSDQMYSYGENGVALYWGTEDFDWDKIPFQAQVSEEENIICFLYFLGDGSQYYRAFRKFDAASHTWEDLGMYLYSNQNGESYQVIQDMNSKQLSMEEYQNQTAVYDNMNWINGISIESPIDDMSYLYSWESAETITQSPEPADVPEVSAENDWYQAYTQKLNDYRAGLADYDLNNELRPMWDLRDLNGDGIPELIISDGGHHTASVSIFTYTDGELQDMALDKHEQHLYLGSWGMIDYNEENHLLHFEESYPSDDNTREVSNFYYTADSYGIMQEDFFYYAENPSENFYQWAYNKSAVSESEYNQKIAYYQAMNWEQIGRKYDFDSVSSIDAQEMPNNPPAVPEETQVITEEIQTVPEAPQTIIEETSAVLETPQSVTDETRIQDNTNVTGYSFSVKKILPIIAGITALIALAAVFFSKKKEN